MRRADRLFQIIQILRSSTKPITASSLASELETSLRTVYRDIADLMAQAVPIRGEAGIGYILEKSYDMPPLMLTPIEIEAAVLGAQWVASRGDSSLVRGARDLIAKIAEVLPVKLRPILVYSTVMVSVPNSMTPDSIDVAKVREWIRLQRRIRIIYRDEKGAVSERIVWPFAVAYFETVRLIVAWCEVKADFRHFRTDRIDKADFLPDNFPVTVDTLRARWWAQEQRIKP